MIELPKSTEFNTKIPKQKFYENLTVNAQLKRSFIDEIKAIYWKNKISPDTINLKAGEEVKEIQIFLVELKEKRLDEKVLLQIDRQIPYHLVFILKSGDLYQLAIGYKEESSSGANAFKVYNYYYSDWQAKEELSLSLRGLSLDSVYENILKEIAGPRLESPKNEKIADLVDRDQEVQSLEKELEKLRNKRRKTKQINKQMKMNDQIRAAKEKIKKLKNS